MWLTTALTLVAAGALTGNGQPQDTLLASQISAGGRNSCAVTEFGVAYCWGANSQGQIGTGARTTQSQPTPARVATGALLAQVAVGGRFVCGLTEEGDAFCWGNNRDGQLGNGTTSSGLEPGLVLASEPLGQIVLGPEHACALDVTGAAYCWGKNNNGQAGDGKPLSRGSYYDKPVAVSGGYQYQQLVTIGADASCGLTRSGQAYCWGLVDLMNWKAKPTTTPVLVSDEMVFTLLAGGSDHLCGLSNGRAYCWGDNRAGQLGDSTNKRRPTPTAVTTDSSFVGLTAGSQFTCALTVAGQAWCWGANQSGQLGSGEGSFANQGWNLPRPVFGPVTFQQIVAGDSHTCGLATFDVVYCWGENSIGQLGTGTQGWRNIPTVVVAGP
jgi:alpha-tubulin suppressor-like RCC1 family protein